jgi:predicted DNA-binding protein
MMSVRLPEPLESLLAAYCESAGLSKSAVVQAALEKHLKKLAPGLAAASGTKIYKHCGVVPPINI